MSTLTSRLGLYKPATTEFYNVITDQNNNWDSLDAFVGFVPSTSATRPASAFNGMSIRETDTGRLWVSDGSAPSSGSWKTQPLVSNVPASAALTTDLVLRQRVGTEANDRMNIRGDGRIQWGPGTAAVDTNLYRSAASVLRTDDAFQALRFINPITTTSAAASATLSATTTEQDISGATVAVTTQAANAKAIVIGVFNMRVVSASASAQVNGFLNVDGTTITAPVARLLSTTNSTRTTCVQCWEVTLPAAGAHTLKLRANISAAGGTYEILQPDTTITAMVIETA